MKIRKIFLVLVVLCLALNVYHSRAFAYHGCETEEGRYDLEDKFFSRAHFILKNSEELGLSDKQIEKIKDLKVNIKKDFIRKDAEIEILTIEGKIEIEKEPLNKDAVDKLIDKAYDLKKAKTKSLIDAYTSLDDMLTEEQNKKLKELRKVHKKEMMGKMHSHMKGE